MEETDERELLIGRELEDVHKFPFSVFRNAKTTEKTGNVREIMDKVIGKKAFRIRGNVSANNYLEINRLRLQGSVIYIQLKTIDEFHVAFHMDMVLRSGPLSVAFSSLHSKPTYLGHGLRLPLNLRPGAWTTIAIRPEELLAEYTPFKRSDFKFVRRFQLCANMYIRDIVTSNCNYEHVQEFPKELAYNPNFVARTKDLIEERVVWYPAKPEHPHQLALATTRETDAEDAENINLNRTRQPSAGSPMKPPQQQQQQQQQQQPARTSSSARDDLRFSLEQESAFLGLDEIAQLEDGSAMRENDRSQQQLSPSRHQNTPKQSPKQQRRFDTQSIPSRTPRRTPRPSPRKSGLHASEDELGLQRVLQYSGTTCAFADDDTAIVASNNLLVFQALADADDTQKTVQEFHQLHSHAISTFALSRSARLLVAAHRGPYPALCLYDLPGRACLAVASYWGESIEQAVFSSDERFIATVGLDAHHRVQVTVWSVEAMIAVKSTGVANKSVVAKQTSDFPIHRIKFSPLDSQHLVSCGRENVRFWRVKKEHLPAQSAILNEYARGTMFTDLAVAPLSGAVPGSRRDANQVQLLVSTDTGCLLQFDYASRTVLQAFKLHNQAIRAFELSAGYVVTGGDDCILRVWPLDFTDFLLEAHHEAPVTSLATSQDGTRVLIGTTSGTLGVLDVSQHGYRTVLRSHVGPALAVAARPGASEEFATIGVDHTIRIWDAVTGQQKFEFNSPDDLPTCIAYHPHEHVLACGFRSGCVRVFDVPGTSTLHEIQAHQAEVHTLLFEPNGLRLYSCCADHQLAMHDTRRMYQTVRLITFEGVSSQLQVAVSHDGSLLAVAGSSIASIMLLDAARMVPVHRFEHDALREQPSLRPVHRSHGSDVAAATATAPAAPAAERDLLVGGGGAVELCDEQNAIGANEIRRMGFFKSGTLAVFAANRLILFWPPEHRQKHWERLVVRLPSCSPAAFCTIRDETQLVLLFQSTAAEARATPAATTELCIFRMEQDASVGKLNWSTTSGARSKLSLSKLQALQLLNATTTGLAATEMGSRIITVDDQGAVRIWLSGDATDQPAAQGEQRSTTSQPSSPVKMASNDDVAVAAERESFEQLSDGSDHGDPCGNVGDAVVPNAQPGTSILRYWAQKRAGAHSVTQQLQQQQQTRRGNLSLSHRECLLRTVPFPANGFVASSSGGIHQAASSDGQLLVQWSQHMLLLRKLSALDSALPSTAAAVVPSGSARILAVRVFGTSASCAVFWRQGDDLLLSTLHVAKSGPVCAATEAVLQVENGTEFETMLTCSSSTEQILLALSVPRGDEEISRTLHLYLLNARGDGELQLQQHLPLPSAITGPTVGCSVHGDFAQLTTASATAIICLPTTGQLSHMTLMPTLSWGDDAAVCSSFLPAKGRALQLCTLTASGLVLVHTVGETSPKKYQLHFSPDQQCACVCPLGDKLYVGFRDGRVISSQLKTSSVEQNHVATVAGPVSLLQIVADQDLLICHNEACVSLLPDVGANRSAPLSLVQPIDPLEEPVVLLQSGHAPTALARTFSGDVQLVHLFNGNKLWQLSEFFPADSVRDVHLRFSSSEPRFRAGVVTSDGIAAVVDSKDLSDIQPINACGILGLHRICLLSDDYEHVLLGCRDDWALLLARVDDNGSWVLQPLEGEHASSDDGFILDKLSALSDVPNHVCVSYAATDGGEETLVQLLAVSWASDGSARSTVVASLMLAADSSACFAWPFKHEFPTSDGGDEHEGVGLLAVTASGQQGVVDMLLTTSGDNFRASAPAGFSAEGVRAFFCLNRYLLVSNQGGQLAVYRLRLRAHGASLDYLQCHNLQRLLKLPLEHLPVIQLVHCQVNEVQANIEVAAQVSLLDDGESDESTTMLLQLALPM